MKITYLNKAKKEIVTKLVLPGVHLRGRGNTFPDIMSLSRQFALKVQERSNKVTEISLP